MFDSLIASIQAEISLNKNQTAVVPIRWVDCKAFCGFSFSVEGLIIQHINETTWERLGEQLNGLI